MDTLETSVSSFVPLRSVWLLQLYASELYQTGGITDSFFEDSDAELPELVASMLCEHIEERLQRELSITFARTADVLHRVRGRIDVFHTQRRRLLEKGQVVCRFEELSVDSDVNRYLLVALNKAANLLKMRGHSQLAQRARRSANTLQRAGVTLVGDKASFPRGRIARADKKALAAAQLLLEMTIPSGGRGDKKFVRKEVSEEYLRALFENALVGLYRYHLQSGGWQISGGKHLHWDVEGDTDLLPGMITDIMMVDPSGHQYIADAKFTNMIVRARRSEIDRLKSAHLYQIYAYLMSQEPRGGRWKNASGIMIYGTTSGIERQDFTIQGHRITFVALDLTKDARTIRETALSIGSMNNGQAIK